MFGSAILEAAIGLGLMYLLLSLIASAAQEAVESLLKNRASNLEQGLRELLQDPDGSRITRHLYSHPLIFGLFRGEYQTGNTRTCGGLSTNLPTYIPAGNFAAALIDLIVRGPVDKEAAAPEPAQLGTAPAPASAGMTDVAPADAQDAIPSGQAAQGASGAETREGTAGNPAEGVLTIEKLREAVPRCEILGPSLQRVVLLALDSAHKDLGKAQANLEAWFNSSMDRVSGWYKRRVQWILLVIGMLVAVGLNVDSLNVVRELYRNDALRAAAVAEAGVMTKSENAPAPSFDVVGTLDKLKLPIWWPDEDVAEVSPLPRKILTCIWQHLFGWVITGFAISFGAPFWFDILNKLMVVRSTVKPHEKSPEESSEDRQVKERSSTKWRL